MKGESHTMKKTFKRIICLALVVAFVASLAGCAKINYVTKGTIGAINEVKSGEWKNTGATEEEEVTDDVVIDELTPGTYGGVEFKTVEDVAQFYVDAYNYTKTLTAEYITEDGSKATYYKLLGTEDIQIGDVLIDGKANSTINGLVPGIVGGMFAAGTYGLVPCSNRDPNLDNNSENVANGEIDTPYDFRTSLMNPAEDILAANVTDNGDGTITLELQPKMQELAMRGEGPQGTTMEVLGDISGVVAGISIVKFEQGTAEENIKVLYRGSTIKVKVDTKTKEIVEADYNMVVDVAVNHATVTIIKDKSAKLQINYTNHYPADDEYLMNSKKIKRA